MGKLLNARVFLAVLVGALTAGCSGGGGGGAVSAASPILSPPPPPPPPVYPSASSSEYQNNWGVASVGAMAAWQSGATGGGIKIAIIDEGVDASHAELAGRVVSSMDTDNVRNAPTSVTTNTHGSNIAGIIASNFNGAQTVGVAFDSSIINIRADNGSGSFSSSALTSGINYAVANGARVINLSIGGSGPLGGAFTAALSNATNNGIIVVISAGNCGAVSADCPTAETEVEYPAFYATNSSISHGLIIPVGALTKAGAFASFSNPAGAAANWYVVAPGTQVIVPDFGTAGASNPSFEGCGTLYTPAANLCQIAGTSYAAPHVAGAFALLLQAFPGMTPAQVVDLLLNHSTDDMGAAGVDSTTGHGKLNLTKAFAPVGAVSVPLGSSGQEIYAGNEIGITGAAFGNAFHNQEAWRAVGFDSFDRSFLVSLASLWRATGAPDRARDSAPLLWQSRAQGPYALTTSFALVEPPPPLAAGMIGETGQTPFRSELSLGEGRRLSFANGVAAATSVTPAEMSGHMAFAGYDHGAALLQDIGKDARLSIVAQDGVVALGHGYGESTRRATLARVDYWAGPASIGASIGSVVEEGSILGTTWARGLGAPPESMTRFLGLSTSLRIAPGLSAGIDTEFGGAKISGGTNWLATDRELVTTAGAASLRWGVIPTMLKNWLPDANGTFTLSVSQPLRVERGAFSAMLPSANEWGRPSLTFSPRTISVTPTGRELDASVTYSLWAAENFTARVSAIYAREPGHDREAPAEKAMTLGLRYGF